jgi:D-alanine-D-alanine ligase
MSFNMTATSQLPLPRITVLAGGVSAEREVSLGSGAASAAALARHWPTRLLDVTDAALPAGLDPAQDVVFSTLHGTFGEDGGMQRLLDAAGIIYAGCDAAASELTMNKAATKRAAAGAGVRVAPDKLFTIAPGTPRPEADELVAALRSENIVLKPNAEGSSVGLALPEGRVALAAALAALTPGSWLAEPRLVGRELSVGVVGGRALGVVEIRPRSGVYDFASKYTKGATEYLAPAPLDEATTGAVKNAAERAFAACGCRDYARVDFILISSSEFYLLEINTLPGMKETSLLPMSARCLELDFTALVRELAGPAVRRFQETRLSAHP